MKRSARLTRSTDIKRVRRLGKSYAHPLIVLYAYPTANLLARVCVVTGAAVGNAVHRNRLRRQIRACIQHLYAFILPGYDLMVIVRHAAQGAQFARIESAVWEVFTRAKVIETQIDNEPLARLPE